MTKNVQDIRVECSQTSCLINTLMFSTIILITSLTIIKLRECLGVKNICMILSLIIILAVREINWVNNNWIANSSGNILCHM